MNDEAAQAASDSIGAWCAENPAPTWPVLPEGVRPEDFTEVWHGTLELDPATGETRMRQSELPRFTAPAGPLEITYTPVCQHTDAQRVHTIEDVHVGWLCPDCDAVLPPEWVSYSGRSRQLAEAHDQDHHGASFVMVLGCPRCADETMGRG